MIRSDGGVAAGFSAAFVGRIGKEVTGPYNFDFGSRKTLNPEPSHPEKEQVFQLTFPCALMAHQFIDLISHLYHLTLRLDHFNNNRFQIPNPVWLLSPN